MRRLIWNSAIISLLVALPCRGRDSHNPGSPPANVGSAGNTTPEQDKAETAAELATLPPIDIGDLGQLVQIDCHERDLQFVATQQHPTGMYHVIFVPPMMVAQSKLTPSTGPADGSKLPPLLPQAPALPRMTPTLRRSLIKFNALDQMPQPDAQRRNFNLIVADYDVGPGAYRLITISKAADHLMLDCDSGVGERSDYVQLIQDPPQSIDAAEVGNDPASRVRLIVQMSSAEDAGTTLTRSAGSFVDLRRTYPADVNRLIRPLARDLGVEDRMFAVYPLAAWQVVGSDAPPDAQTEDSVKKVLTDLDAQDFKQRLAAQRRLEEMGEPAALALYRLDRSKLSPEAAGAVESFLAGYHPLTDAEAARLGHDPDFLLDVLFCDDAELRQLAAARLERQCHAEVPAAVTDARTPTWQRTEMVDALRAKLLPVVTTGPASVEGR
jgi:hypothetical protein